MTKSIYYDYVKRFFPKIVVSVVEKLNEKRTNQLPYLYREMLEPEYSADGRWASILGQYTRVAADVVALDTELPLKSRDTIEVAHGEIPKMGMKCVLSEKQISDIDAMIAQGKPIELVMRAMFNDVRRVIEGIYERMEDMFLSGLSSGVALSGNSTGTGVRLSYGFLKENQFSCHLKKWSEDATTDAMGDLRRVFDKAEEDQNVITDCYADDAFLRALYKNNGVRAAYAFTLGYNGSAQAPVLGFDQLATVFMTQFGCTLHRVSRKVRTELNGVQKKHSPWKSGIGIFTCDNVVGKMVYADLAEKNRPVEGVTYQAADEYILASRYSLTDPLREITASQARVVPIINNVDQIYQFDSTQTNG